LTLKLWCHNLFDAEAYLQRGWEQLQQPNWAAIADLRTAIQLRPDLPEAQRLLADAYLLTGQREAALAALGKHLEQRSSGRNWTLSALRPRLFGDDRPNLHRSQRPDSLPKN